MLRTEHVYLTAEDECYCLGEYQPRAGFSAGPVNNMISNFKKPVSRRGLPEYRHKEAAILLAAKLVRAAFNKDRLQTCTFIPIPPSKARSDPLYDDRILRVLTSGEPKLDVRDAFSMRQSTRAHHEHAEGERRPSPDELYRSLQIDEPQLIAPPQHPTIVLVDDLLTNGTHFKACKRLVLECRPDARVIGMFIGRRKVPPPSSAFMDLLDE